MSCAVRFLTHFLNLMPIAAPYSVIIPSKDRVSMLAEALDSVFGQSLPPASVQLVVDEPEDGEKYAFLGRYDSRLCVHFTGGGAGGAEARNIGLEQVATPYLFFLDDDDLWLPHKIERQIQAFHDNPDWVGVTCWRTEEQGEKRRDVRVSQWWLRTFGRAYNVIGSFSQFGLRVDERTRDLRLEPSLRSAQDLEFYLQVWRVGIIGLIEESLIRYRNHAGPRITGSNTGNFQQTLLPIYRKHRDMLQRREEYYWRARLAVQAARGPAGRLRRLSEFFRVLSNLLASGMLILGSEWILRTAVARLLGRI
jgi:glycosyltransferase involved in cell wall biosynthesis